MKIGIMTFHWATNYGAVLQAYCLQAYLREQGHDVEIINYKLSRYDISLWNYFKHPSNWKRYKKYINLKRKENLIESFRTEYLHCSKRYYSTSELQRANLDYDVLISGTDQVLNASYTMYAEGKPCPAYFLGFGKSNVKRIGYAVSFGCTEYPISVVDTTKAWIDRIDYIGVREVTGLNILQQLSYKNYCQTVPDPTILFSRRLFESVGAPIPKNKDNYICVYMLRYEITINGNVRYIDETKSPISMQQWLTTISHAEFLITNSYHGTIMAILSHVPFAVLIEKGKDTGMNDRFYTLLEKIGMSHRIVSSLADINTMRCNTIDWENIDAKIADYMEIGRTFLREILQDNTKTVR